MNKTPSQKKQWKSLLAFLRTGQYSVAYPKQDAEKTVKSCCGGHKCATTTSTSTSSSQRQIESLFSRIETEIGEPETFSTKHTPLPFGDSAVKPMSSIHSEQPETKETAHHRAHPQKETTHDHDHSHGHAHSDDDLLDDFDNEFANSQYNTYYDLYGEDNDDDEAFSSNNAFYNQEDDEESLLKSRKL